MSKKAKPKATEPASDPPKKQQKTTAPKAPAVAEAGRRISLREFARDERLPYVQHRLMEQAHSSTERHTREEWRKLFSKKLKESV